MNQFSLEELTHTVTRPDTWELLGNPTGTLVAETIVSSRDYNMWGLYGETKSMPLDDLAATLTARHGVTTAEALARIADEIDAGVILCWYDEDCYMVCVNRHEARRLKARWAFNMLCRWAETGTAHAYDLLRVGVGDAIITYETQPPFGQERRGAVRPLAEHVGLSLEQAFRLLNSDGFDSFYDHGFSDDAIRTKRRTAYRIIDFLTSARRGVH